MAVIKSLEKHGRKKGFSVGEIAEALGMFPSDVEMELKRLLQEGLVRCYIYKGQLFAIFEERKGMDWDLSNENEFMYL